MTTTLSAMHWSRIKRAIIGGLLVPICLLLAGALSGCSNVKLAYGTGPQLTWWWLDDYFDFEGDQAKLVHERIDQLFAWHRATQLAGYAAFLEPAAAQIVEPVTDEQACRWERQIRAQLEPTLDKALALAADAVPGLGEAQFGRLAKRYGKNIKKARDDYLQPDLQKRHKAAVKRALDYAEKLYGSLDDAQKRVLDAGIAASPFDPERWIAERRRRQRDTEQTLRKLVADRADAPQRVAAMRALVARIELSPDPEYRAYNQRLTDYNCALAAQLHNATTPAQRRKARETIKGWQNDFRTLAAGA